VKSRDGRAREVREARRRAVGELGKRRSGGERRSEGRVRGREVVSRRRVRRVRERMPVDLEMMASTPSC
jgi:hypothetical protein